jgi:hypothetical protein
MTPQEVREHFKTGYVFQKQTGMSANTLANWKKWGYVPFKSQRKLEHLTNGVLKAVWDEKEPFFSPIKSKD